MPYVKTTGKPIKLVFVAIEEYFNTYALFKLLCLEIKVAYQLKLA